jgi:hypothetical protein
VGDPRLHPAPPPRSQVDELANGTSTFCLHANEELGHALPRLQVGHVRLCRPVARLAAVGSTVELVALFVPLARPRQLTVCVLVVSSGMLTDPLTAFLPRTVAYSPTISTGASSHDSLPHAFASPQPPSLLSSVLRSILPSQRRGRALTRGRAGPPRKRTIGLVILALSVACWLATRIWELQLELALYRKEWVRTDLLDLNEPELDLVGACFPHSVGGRSYSTGAAGLQSTLALTHPGDCFAFASLLRQGPQHASDAAPTTFHTYWRADLAAFGERQALMVKSFLATQPLEYSRLVLWTTGPLNSPLLDELVRDHPSHVEVRIVDYAVLAKGTALEGRADLLGPAMRDTQAWLDGDLVRLLALWSDGGVWVDMDVLLVRDLAPLLVGEWVEQWDCYSALFVCSRRACPTADTGYAGTLQTSRTKLSTARSCTSNATRPTCARSSP